MMGRVFILTSILATALLLSVITPTALSQTPPNGPWVDEVVIFVEQDQAKAVDMLLKNEMQVYFRELRDPELFRRVRASPELRYVMSYGLHYELTFNPVGPEFPATGKLNPFSVPRIREAMHLLVDRNYIASEIMGGLGVPRYTALSPSFPDYGRYADLLRQVETQYAYNLERARAIVGEEMTKLGAQLRDGKWYYKGEPVSLIFLIRVEDQRRQIGDYVSSQLERLGFTVDRQYKTSREASPIWIRGDPKDGQWHLYTGGWITTSVSRDEGDNFGFFFTPRGQPVPLWQAYKPDPEFDRVAARLWNREYKTVEERDELMRKAITYSMKDSVRVWLIHQTAPWPARKDVQLTYDLAAGYSGARLWPYTLKYADKIGGTVKIASSDLLVEPVNPVAGSNWIYDAMFYRATSDPALIPDPYTGLYLPQRIKRAEVYALDGTPIAATLDYVSLRFVPEIKVPEDAWYGWDAEEQRIVYAPTGTTAKTKTVVYFEDDLFKRKFHDGSTLSLADIVFSYILTFDRADPKSPVYDESYVPVFEEFRATFKGFKILNKEPLVIEYYSDVAYLDAEWNVNAAASAFFTDYGYGPGPWHTVAVAWLAEANNELAFSADKAEQLKVEWTSFVAGPSIDVLKKYLNIAIGRSFIPYEQVLGEYVSRREALQRYDTLRRWVDSRGHFLVGNGPFYLDRVDPTAKIVVLKAFREFPDPPTKWAGFAEPMIPEIKVAATPTIETGFPAEVPLTITFKGQPYREEDMAYVKYILMSAAGTSVGFAEPLGGGSWRVVLKPEETYKLPTGAAKLEVIAVSKKVGVPATATATLNVLSFKEGILSEVAKARADLEAKVSTLDAQLRSLTSSVNRVSSGVEVLQGTVNLVLGLAVLAVVISLVGIALSLTKRK
ncbi:MAG: ABC transporter substrate-binding protein [Candidatus Caldarchaeum sp.]|nr:ABC transporter substrate-binding protein [Candidatus Caldarchaeum sp.]MDW7978797.1 ABC transporter substrate-binding protein [Candidatus Caldarchaeum sp.]